MRRLQMLLAQPAANVNAATVASLNTTIYTGGPELLMITVANISWLL